MATRRQAKEPELEIGDGGDPIPVDLDRVAQLFDVTEKTVRSWVKEGLPVIKAGRQGRGNKTILDLSVVIPWYLEENALDVAKTRLATAQAEKHEMDNALRRGELAEAAAVESEWGDLVAAARAKLLALPAKLGPQLTNVADAAVIAARIRAEVYAVLVELAADEDRPREPARDPTPRRGKVRAAAAADGERVGRREPKAQ